MMGEYTVTGMSCEHCVNSVTNELLEIPGVSAVNVDLESGLVQVTSAAPLPIEQVAAAIDEAGYELATTN